MIERILSALRRGATAPVPERQWRPNELSGEAVRAEQLRREAAQAATAARASRPAPQEAQAPRERSLMAPDTRAAVRRPLSQALKSRSALRQAWVMKEVLGPPVALRGPHEI